VREKVTNGVPERQNDVVTTQEPGPVVVGIMYPAFWETRPAEELEADFAKLTALGVEIVDVRYIDPPELRTKRGAAPLEDFRHLAPELTAEQREAFARVEVVLAMDLPFDVATLAPNLRWVQGTGAGVSQLTSAGLADAGIRLTTAAGSNAVSISEFVIARLLQMWKRLPEIDAFAEQHKWQPTYGREINGLTLGVVGLGAIGRQVARRARALGLNVIAQRRTAKPGDTDPDVDELLGLGGLEEMAARSDAIVAAVPETADTVDLFDDKFFASMRPGALFVNVGRGSAVVEEALVEALESDHLAGAAIDVVRDEPLTSNSTLWDVRNLWISPHSATAPDQFWSNVYELFRENVQHYLAGEPLRNEVDARVGG
jgi:phosphoglycerate dehydrogenase-like enzyme